MDNSSYTFVNVTDSRPSSQPLAASAPSRTTAHESSSTVASSTSLPNESPTRFREEG